MTVDDIIREIKLGSFTNDDIDNMFMAIKHARAQLGHEVRRELRIGQTVYFHDHKGRRVQGTVTGIKIKNAIVKAGLSQYRVPCNMLEIL